MTSISGIFTIRNAIEAGYPFVESVLSVLPAVDEMLVADGGSDDGTDEVLQRLARTYPKVRFYQLEDGGPGMKWEAIDDALNHLIGEASGDWIFESQGDEVWHEDDILAMRDLVYELDDSEYNSIRQRRIEADLDGPQPEHLMWTVRVVRRLPELTSFEGGDSFMPTTHYLGPTEGFTCHNVQPEYHTNIPFYHYYAAFEENRVAKYERHATWLATGSEVRKQAYEDLLAFIERERRREQEREEDHDE